MYDIFSAGDDVGAHFKKDDRMSPRQLANHCVRMKCDDCGKTQGRLMVLGLLLAITDGLHLHHVLCVCDGSVTLTPCTTLTPYTMYTMCTMYCVFSPCGLVIRIQPTFALVRVVRVD